MSFEVFSAEPPVKENHIRQFLKPFPGGLVINRALHKFFKENFENKFSHVHGHYRYLRHEINCKLMLDDESGIIRLEFPESQNKNIKQKDTVTVRVYDSISRQSIVYLPTSASYKLQERIGVGRCFVKEIQFTDSSNKTIKHIDFHYSTWKNK